MTNVPTGRAGRRGRLALFVASIVLVTSGTSAVAAASDWSTPVEWSITRTLPNRTFAGVSCAPASPCVAVGHGSDFALTAVLQKNKWIETRNPYVGRSAALTGVSCVNATTCAAVGTYFDGHHFQTLTEVWDGKRFTLEPSPRSITEDELAAVSCGSARRCVAVGRSTANGRTRPVAAIRSGTRWWPMPLPALPQAWSGSLSAVSCVSALRCVAVGSMTPPGQVKRTLIETWDGTSWSLMLSPTLAGPWDAESLLGVSCTSGIDCFAVGTTDPRGRVGRTLIQRWDGTSWSVVPSPNSKVTAPHVASSLAAVSCVRATSCVAVGSALRDRRPAASGTLVEGWDGARWSVAAGPTNRLAYGYRALNGVSCTKLRCAAVGFHDEPGDPSPTLALVGFIPPRVASPSWTAVEVTRLQQIASYFGVTLARAQKIAVYTTAYLDGLGPHAPTPVTLRPPGSDGSYPALWAPEELGVLDSVRVKFALNSNGATRASVYLLSYLLALRGV